MIPDDLSSISDGELERRIIDARPNSYVPSSVYHVYVAELEKRKYQNLLEAVNRRKRISKSNRTNSNYRKSMSNRDMRILWGKARNRCSLCKKRLIHPRDEQGVDVVVGIEAHIVGHRKNGPRGDHPMPLSERHKYPNRILLCMECSKIIDEQQEKYTIEILQQIKRTHEEEMEEQQNGSSNSPKLNSETFKEMCADSHLSNPSMFSTYILIVPQNNLELYDKESDGSLYSEWHQYGLYDAIHAPTIFTSNPLPGVTYGFERKGKLFYAKTAHEENAEYCSKVSILQDGKIYLRIKYLGEDYCEDTFIKELKAFLDFIVKFYLKKGMLPNEKLEIWVGFEGLQGRELKRIGSETNPWDLLNKRVFHEDDFWEMVDKVNFEKLPEENFPKTINDTLIEMLNKYSMVKRRLNIAQTF